MCADRQTALGTGPKLSVRE